MNKYFTLFLLLIFEGSLNAATVSQHDAIPVLLRRCVMCHGQDAQESGLDLRTKSSMLEGKAFVSGKPNESAMIKRITSRQCPPDKNISMAGIESDEKIVSFKFCAIGLLEVRQKWSRRLSLSKLIQKTESIGHSSRPFDLLRPWYRRRSWLRIR